MSASGRPPRIHCLVSQAKLANPLHAVADQLALEPRLKGLTRAEAAYEPCVATYLQH